MAGVLLATFLPGGSSPALAIESQGDWIEVRIADGDASAAEMERELRAVGIDVIPMTADNVGRWVCGSIVFGSPAGGDALPAPDRTRPTAAPLDHAVRVTPDVVYLRRGGFDELRLDRSVIQVGRAAEPGEQPADRAGLCGVGG